MRYLNLAELLGIIDPIDRVGCVKLLNDHRKLIEAAPGSSHNHQAWPGGYLDHVVETMNVAADLYPILNSRRPLPFTRSQALVVMFLHDLEKPWKGLDFSVQPTSSKEERRAFRDARVKEYLQLTDVQWNALRYVEGEHDDYTPRQRMMGPLAAFCHMCDIASARLWPEHPLVSGDPWQGARRSACCDREPIAWGAAETPCDDFRRDAGRGHCHKCGHTEACHERAVRGAT